MVLFDFGGEAGLRVGLCVGKGVAVFRGVLG